MNWPEVIFFLNEKGSYCEPGDRKWGGSSGLAWQLCEDGGTQSLPAAAAAVVLRLSLRLRLRLRREGGERSGWAAQPTRPQGRRPAGQECTCCRCRWGLPASKGDRLEAGGGGGLSGGPDPPLSQAYIQQQPGRYGMPARPQRGKWPLVDPITVHSGTARWWASAGCVALVVQSEPRRRSAWYWCGGNQLHLLRCIKSGNLLISRSLYLAVDFLRLMRLFESPKELKQKKTHGFSRF